MKSLELLYKAYYKKIRGKAKEGYIRPTIQEFFTTHPDYVAILKGLSIGDRYVFDGSDPSRHIKAVSLGNNKVVIAWPDYDKISPSGGKYFSFVVCTVDNGELSFGNIVTYDKGSTYWSKDIELVYDSYREEIVVFYTRVDNYYGEACVGNVDGNTIIFGNPSIFESSHLITISAVYDQTNQKIVLAYVDYDDPGAGERGSTGKCRVGYGTYYGSYTYYWDRRTGLPSVVHDTLNNKTIILFNQIDDYGNYKGAAVAGTVTGNSITFGQTVWFNWDTSYYISTTFDTINNKVVFIYRDDYSNNYYCIVRVGEYSDSLGYISFGPETVFSESRLTMDSEIDFDPNTGKFLIVYKDYESPEYGKAVVGTVSGDEVILEEPFVFSNNSKTSFHTVVYAQGSNTMIIPYVDEDNGGVATVTSVSNY
jgi:hypothetical protein